MVSQAAVWRVAAAACAVGTLIAGAGAAGAAPTSSPGEGRILGADRAGAVAGSYIVTFKDSVARADVDKVARSLTRRHGGKIGHIYTAALHGFSVKVDDEQARRPAADPSVARVEADGVAYALGTQNDPAWGLDRIDQRDLPGDRNFTYPNTASDVTAGFRQHPTGPPVIHSPEPWWIPAHPAGEASPHTHRPDGGLRRPHMRRRRHSPFHHRREGHHEAAGRRGRAEPPALPMLPTGAEGSRERRSADLRPRCPDRTLRAPGRPAPGARPPARRRRDHR